MLRRGWWHISASVVPVSARCSCSFPGSRPVCLRASLSSAALLSGPNAARYASTVLALSLGLGPITLSLLIGDQSRVAKRDPSSLLSATRQRDATILKTA